MSAAAATPEAPEVQAIQGREAPVAQLVADVTDAGCEWMHVDYEPHLTHFYEDSCGFGPTAAGLLRLTGR